MCFHNLSCRPISKETFQIVFFPLSAKSKLSVIVAFVRRFHSCSLPAFITVRLWGVLPGIERQAHLRQSNPEVGTCCSVEYKTGTKKFHSFCFNRLPIEKWVTSGNQGENLCDTVHQNIRKSPLPHLAREIGHTDGRTACYASRPTWGTPRQIVVTRTHTP